MADPKFNELVVEVAKGIKDNLVRGLTAEAYKMYAKEILSRVYMVCDDNILPKPGMLPVVFDEE
jgi:hypothetical protein